MDKHNEQFKTAFFDALKCDRTVMLGLDGVDEGHTRPMTAHIEDHSGLIWFFGGNDNVLVKQLQGCQRVIATFASKGHDLFASINGTIRVENDRAVIDRLWNPFVAAWYSGKDDPNLALLRLDAKSVEIWRAEHSLLTGLKMLFGVDAKADFKDNVAQVALSA